MTEMFYVTTLNELFDKMNLMVFLPLREIFVSIAVYNLVFCVVAHLFCFTLWLWILYFLPSLVAWQYTDCTNSHHYLSSSEHLVGIGSLRSLSFTIISRCPGLLYSELYVLENIAQSAASWSSGLAFSSNQGLMWCRRALRVASFCQQRFKPV